MQGHLSQGDPPAPQLRSRAQHRRFNDVKVFLLDNGNMGACIGLVDLQSYHTGISLLLHLLTYRLLALFQSTSKYILAFLLGHFGQLTVEQGLCLGELDLEHSNK